MPVMTMVDKPAVVDHERLCAALTSEMSSRGTPASSIAGVVQRM